MTFILSKLTWPLLQPLALLLLLVMAGALLSWTGWWRLGRWLVSGAALIALVVGVLPTGPLMLSVLEGRFPTPSQVGDLDGIIVLGGGVNALASAAYGHPSLTAAADRMTLGVMLARQHPEASLVFSGGSGLLSHPDIKEAPAARDLFIGLGVEAGRIVLEDQSRDTYENAVMTRDLVQPQPGERWLLITSAFHMPRAVGCFEAAGWRVIPYPVDYRAVEADGIGLGTPLDYARLALHEWVGLIAYWATGRTNTLFPGPTEPPPLAPTPGRMAQQGGISFR